jgi:CDP-6-deoxy-D-xylo-4-hexulose-3-dehydrase
VKEFWYPLAVPTIGEEEIDAATEVLRSKHTTCGDKVEEFEAAFADYVGAPHAVMVNSGSSADLLIALGAPIGHTALVPAVTWPTHAWSLDVYGRVAFCDVDGVNTTAELIERRLNKAVDCIGVVHLMGVPCDMDPIMELAAERDLVVVEDCCEALGATYHDCPVGSFGLAASWSFFFSHQMTTMEGGMITTADAKLADQFRSMRSHGWERHKGGDPYRFVTRGFNLRPSEIAAAIGLVQLDKLHIFNKIRAMNRATFVTYLAGHPNVTFPTAPLHTSPSWFGLPMFVQEDRDGLAEWLEAHGVETRPILGGNLMRQPAFAEWADDHYPGADYVHDHGLYVGLHPSLDTGVEQVAALVGEYVPA